MKFRRLMAVCLTATMVSSMAPGVMADEASTEGTSSAPAMGTVSVNADAPNTQKTDETLTVLFGSEPAMLWTGGTGNAANETGYIEDAIEDTLVRMDPVTKELKPSLATEWEWTDDQTLELTLRDDVTMYGGQKMTADDVVYTVMTWKEKASNGDNGRNIESAEKIDDTHVSIKFNKVAPDLVAQLSWATMGIVSQADVDAVGGIDAASKEPKMGSGRYKFVEWKNGEYIKLTRNEDYWDPDYAGYFKDIVIMFTSDPAAREMSVESGDAALAVDMPVVQAATYQQGGKVGVAVFPVGSVNSLWYCQKEGRVTSDKAVRTAISMAIDWDAVAMVGTAGYLGAADDYFPADNYYYNGTYADVDRTPDPEGAKKVLEDAGYATDGSLTVSVPATADSVPVYTVMQESLRQAGITFEINQVDIPTFVQSAFGGDYDIIYSDDEVGARYPSLLSYVQNEIVESGFSIGGPKVIKQEDNDLVMKGIQATDKAEAKGYFDQVQEDMKEDVMCSPMFENLKAAITDTDLKGFSTRERGWPDITTLYY